MGVFDWDHTLPRLPVPELASTCDSLKEMIRPLVSEEERQKTSRLLEGFAAATGAGPRLQEELLAWQESRPANSSWLRPFWDDSYLAFRGRVPTDLSYNLQLDQHQWPQPALPALIYGFCAAIGEIADGSFPVETGKAGPLSMDTLRCMFYTRIPSKGKDLMYRCSLAGPLSAAVVCRGNWYLLPLTDEKGRVYQPAAIQEALQDIKGQAIPSACRPAAGDSDAGQPAAVDPIGAMTCAKRDRAAIIRQQLMEHPLNRHSLAAIEQAHFVICLDDGEISSARLIGGESCNRWFDKSVQIIAGPGGDMGLNLEHAGCDAGMWLWFIGRSLALAKELDQKSAAGLGAAPQGAFSGLKPKTRNLPWRLRAETQEALGAERREYDEILENMTAAQKGIKTVTRQQLKKQGCYPDAFVQLLFQVAYYKLTKSYPSVYESVSVRSFYEGRTECVRPCSAAAKDFVVSYVAGREKDVLERPLLQAKYRQAEQEHRRRIAASQAGLGPERHLYGLAAIGEMKGNEAFLALLEDKGYRVLRHNTLSTSSVVAPAVDFFSFAPVMADGLGIGYGLKHDSLQLAVAAYEASGVRARQYLDLVEQEAAVLLDLLG